MAFIQLRSENHRFNELINKELNTTIIKNIRKGTMFSYFSQFNKKEYNIYFKDSNEELSYKNQLDKEFNFHNTSMFNSSLFIYESFIDLFSNLNQIKDLEHSIINFNNVYINDISLFNILKEELKDIDMTITAKYEDVYNIVISSNKGINYLIELSMILFQIISIKTHEVKENIKNKELIFNQIRKSNSIDNNIIPLITNYLINM